MRMTETSCEFSRPQYDLRVEVLHMNDPKKEFARYVKRCGKKAASINAIGNEAFACADGSIVGRVRNQAFTISVAAPAESADAARKAAEQVAGALF